jgi:Flp pilus assembly protein TadB
LLRLKAYAFGWIAWTGQTMMVLIVGLVAIILLPVINRKADEQK